LSIRAQAILILADILSPTRDGLRAAIERAGAETVLVVDPIAAVEACTRFTFAAAAVSFAHRSAGVTLGVPYVVYAEGEQAESVVAALEKRLMGVAQSLAHDQRARLPSQ
jgi:hypothetical protein